MTKYFKKTDEIGEEKIYPIAANEIDSFYSLYGYVAPDGEAYGDGEYLRKSNDGSCFVVSFHGSNYQLSSGDAVDEKRITHENGEDFSPTDVEPELSGMVYWDGGNWRVFTTWLYDDSQQIEEIDFNEGEEIDSKEENAVTYTLYKTSEGLLEYVSSLWQGSGPAYYQEPEKEWEEVV